MREKYWKTNRDRRRVRERKRDREIKGVLEIKRNRIKQVLERKGGPLENEQK